VEACIVPPFWTSAIDGGDWSASRFGCFTSEKISRCIHWIGGRVSSRDSFDLVEKRKILFLPDHPACSPLLYRLINNDIAYYSSHFKSELRIWTTCSRSYVIFCILSYIRYITTLYSSRRFFWLLRGAWGSRCSAYAAIFCAPEEACIGTSNVQQSVERVTREPMVNVLSQVVFPAAYQFLLTAELGVQGSWVLTPTVPASEAT
jgi:hypothetical protein